MNIFFLSMRPKQAARWHANIHIVKMIVETAQLLCNVHHRAADKDSHCAPPFVAKSRIPYKESQAGHRKLGSMIWVAESLGNYRWGVELGLALCREYNRGRGRAAGKQSLHRTQAVLEWLRDHEPNFTRVRRTPVRRRHLAMPEKLKDAPNSVEAYRDYYYSKRRTMPMVWPARGPHSRVVVGPENGQAASSKKTLVLPGRSGQWCLGCHAEEKESGSGGSGVAAGASDTEKEAAVSCV
eukprot:CAMPEP_0115551682 /NCGR_PEP_ID=MMETSP0271-20121206/95854_1 /TAXON_ID=71861 /ORGANISM="Scrippsiella trochoidea, Strain CCMP3099" /LENGTH=238 /DNA_ID=CAMNT_0002985285 /DNA_START=84 /DNA_END=800 /DNA_ORIENTATION=-